MQTNLNTLSSALMRPMRVNPWDMRTPRMGMTIKRAVARAPIEARGKFRQLPLVISSLAMADPSVIMPIGTEAAPMNVAVFRRKASGG